MKGSANVVFMEESKERRERWAKLTEAITSDYDRRVVEVLMDNCKNEYERKYKMSLAQLQEMNTTANIDPFTTYAFPLIRRVYPNLIGRELVSIQPIPQPTGKVFYLDFSYGADFAPTVKGDKFSWNDNQMAKFNPYYAKGRAKGEILGTGDGSNKVFKTKYCPVFEASVVVYVSASATTAYDLDIATGTITFTSAPANAAVVTIDYVMNTEGTKYIPEIDFSISDTSISAETRKMKTKWTLETEQDLMAYHGLSAEQELTGMMADEFQREIDREIVNDLLTGAAAGNVNWAAAKPASYDGSLKEYNETLLHSFLDASQLIYKKRLREANFIVASTEICTRLEKINTFRYAPGADGGNVQIGMNVFGTLSNRFKIIRDPLMAANKALVGYKGASWMETGYVYCPYIPLYATNVFMHPEDLVNVRGIMSRAANVLVSGDFYSTVTIN